MKVLFHCHTEVSACSNIKELDLVKFLDKNSFDVVIVTDHDLITNIHWPNGKVILGSEITSAEGDVIGIFIKEKIPRGLSIKETSKLIHSQDGLVIAPHPCDRLRREAMGTDTLLKNIEFFDIIEDYNSRNLFHKSNREAARIAEEKGFATITGSDAHTLGELSNTHMEMPTFSNKKQFLESLKSATSKRKASGPIPHAKTVGIRLAKKIAQRRSHR